MKKLLSLAVVGVGARWLMDADRRSALLGRLGGARSGLGQRTESIRGSAADLAGTAVSRAAEAVPGVGGGSAPDEGPAIFAGNPDGAHLTDKAETAPTRE